MVRAQVAHGGVDRAERERDAWLTELERLIEGGSLEEIERALDEAS